MSALGRRLGWIALLASLLLSRALAQGNGAGGYRIVRIANSSQGFDPESLGPPALNNRGELAFHGTLRAREGIFRWSAGKLEPVVTEPDHPDRTPYYYFHHPSINDRGEVAFSRRTGETDLALFRTRGDRFIRVASTDPGPFEGLDTEVSLNDRGEVAFLGNHRDRGFGLFSGNGFRRRVHYLERQGRFRSGGFGHSINDRGEVAFNASLGNLEIGNFLRQDGRVRTLALTQDEIGALYRPSLNERGEVAFWAHHADRDATHVIYLWRRGRLTRALDTSGELLNLGHPSLNDRGEIAFAGFFDTGERGLFLISGETVRTVLRAGDALDGSTVAGIEPWMEALNNRGEIAFAATLADGRRGIYLAVPR